MGELKKLPVIVFLSNLYENYKRKQNELTKRKIEFLFDTAYKHFYDQYLILHTIRIGDDVDFHPHFYAARDAKAAAYEVILQVIKDGRINACYQKRIKVLKQMGVRNING